MTAIWLFDIDGTLVDSGGAGRRAIRAGLAKMLGCSEPDVDPDFSFAGMTDRGIMRRALASRGVPVDDDRIDAAIEAYLEVLPGEVASSTRYRVHPGVGRLLDELHGRSELALGLGTGNARQGAMIKLGRAQLDHYFGFGGFGDECERREELIRRGIERGARRLGCEVGEASVIVVGDTPADIEAAQRNGADCLAVATGSRSRDELEACEPRWLVDSLEDEVVDQLVVSR